ncbi:MAG: DNA repair protein RecN [Acidobacteria bacterium]|nr:DNA repair protein RecN [Acidobacteriota bacterium]
MLKFLSIENFALINHLEVDFEQGLNLITGETGSGKSILIDAVALLVGERASQEMVRSGCERARVEGIFQLHASHPARAFLKKASIPLEGDNLIVRREIVREGGNRIFLNGILTTLAFLTQLGTLLADIHGQHDQQVLLDPSTHLDFIDRYGSDEKDLAELRALFSELTDTRAQLEQLRRGEQERLQRTDHLRFQIEEIQQLALQPGEDLELTQEKTLLLTAERRRQACLGAFDLLYESEPSLLARLDRVHKAVETAAALDSHLQSLSERLREIQFTLEEAAYELRDYLNQIDGDPGRLEMVEERLQEIQRVQKKYANSTDELLAYWARIKQELEALAGADQFGDELMRKTSELHAQFLRKAQAVSQKRRQAARRLEKEMERELAELAMENTLFQAHLTQSDEVFTEKGIDCTEFLISPNPGEPPKPLARIASGGELSRIVLALKSIATLENYPKTLVFDEIDSGIGGRVATTLGEKLARLAERHQVFCVTHLPQIASWARQHFQVTKSPLGERTVVQIRALDENQRVEELAHMMAGGAVTETTRRQARELLKMTRPASAPHVTSRRRH